MTKTDEALFHLFLLIVIVLVFTKLSFDAAILFAIVIYLLQKEK